MLHEYSICYVRGCLYLLCDGFMGVFVEDNEVENIPDCSSVMFDLDLWGVKDWGFNLDL